MTGYYDYEKYGTYRKEDTGFFFFKNSGLQNHSVLYRQVSLNDNPVVFYDVNELDEDGLVSIKGHRFSKYFCFGLLMVGLVSTGHMVCRRLDLIGLRFM